MIEFCNVEFRYSAEMPLLSEVTFSIVPHSFYFLTGSSGAGKTTIFRLMLGINKPTDGSVILYGKDTRKMTREEIIINRRRIASVFQSPYIIDSLTVYENVLLPRMIDGGTEIKNRQIIIEIINWIGLGRKKEEMAGNLSGGEKQRVAIAQAIVRQPEIIIADEPTANVDPKNSKNIMSLFSEVNKTGTSIVFATHDLRLCDQVDRATNLVIKNKTIRVAGLQNVR